MTESKADQSVDAQISRIETTIKMGFDSVNDKLDRLASRDELKLAVEERNNKIEQTGSKLDVKITDHEKRIARLEEIADKPLYGVVVITGIISVTVTFLVTFFLQHLGQ